MSKIMRSIKANLVQAIFLTTMGAGAAGLTYFTKQVDPEKHRQDRIERTLKEKGSSTEIMDQSHIDFLDAQEEFLASVGNADMNEKEKAMHEADDAYGEQLKLLELRDQGVYHDQVIIPPPWDPMALTKSLSPNGIAYRVDAFAGEGTSLGIEHKTVQDRVDHKWDETENSALWGGILGLMAALIFRRKSKPVTSQERVRRPDPVEPKQNHPTDLTVQRKYQTDLTVQKNKEAADLMVRQSTDLTKRKPQQPDDKDYIDINVEVIDDQKELGNGQKRLPNAPKQLPPSPKKLGM
jgi:hypothetical protein